MVSWQEFEEAEAKLAATGRERMHGRVSYLATARADGSPRVHPVTPVVGAERLFAFMEATSPKRGDLLRDGRYALHCGVEDNSGGGGEFFVWGEAEAVEDAALRREAVEAASYEPAERYVLFELGVSRAEWRTYEGGKAQVERWPR